MTTVNPSVRIHSLFFSNWTSDLDQSIFPWIYSLENSSYAIYQQEHVEYDLFNIQFPLRLFSTEQKLDFKSYLSNEIPGFSTYEKNVIIAHDQFDTLTMHVHESGPPLEDIMADREAVFEEESEKKDEKQAEIQHKTVYLYSSHNRESFLPHLPKETSPNHAYHESVNITKVSERLAEKLEASNIGTVFDKTDITKELHKKGWTYSQSYQASRPIVEAAMSDHSTIKYLFDLHRDSLPYEKTTLIEGDRTYATILFVIGAENKQYEKNLNLATKLHYMLEEKKPGLSRGVITKEGPNTNGIYNQDLMQNALLMEIGGYDNHLDELYRTIDLFADVFQTYYFEAEKVDGGL